MLSCHMNDYPSFFTYSALILESNVIERMNRLLVCQEGELGLENTYDEEDDSTIYDDAEIEPYSGLISAKEESI